jgi:hypothetical protein
VQCHTDPTTARARISERASLRTAHADAALLATVEDGDRYFNDFRRLALAEAPSIDVDTTVDYAPTIEDLVAFVDAER